MFGIFESMIFLFPQVGYVNFLADDPTLQPVGSCSKLGWRKIHLFGHLGGFFWGSFYTSKLPKMFGWKPTSCGGWKNAKYGGFKWWWIPWDRIRKKGQKTNPSFSELQIGTIHVLLWLDGSTSWWFKAEPLLHSFSLKGSKLWCAKIEAWGNRFRSSLKM